MSSEEGVEFYMPKSTEEQIKEIKRIAKMLGLKKVEMVNPQTGKVEVEIDVED